MKTVKLLSILSVLAIAALSCGDNKTPDMPVDSSRADAPPDAITFPAVPTLGAQIERMGRPAINTALNAAFLDTATNATAKRDSYNQASNPATWSTTQTVATGRTIVQEFMTNLAIIDVLDQGCDTATCNGAMAVPDADAACGTQVLYNGMPGGGGTAAATSYGTLATILADDMLYADTSKGMCPLYLAVEFAVATGGANTTCGGRHPNADVIDFSYSIIAAGLNGIDITGGFIPRIRDGVGPHADITNTFPFFGMPASGT
jgi:hypothetical protein